MSSEVAVREQAGGLVTREYLQEKAALVRQLYAPDANDLEFEHFVEVCVTRGLNPLAKQIYLVSRFDKKANRKVATIQTGIDGFRLIAQRSGEYRGQVGPQWCGDDGQWRDVWLDEKTAPSAARVGVMREGFTDPLYGVVTWTAYADTQSPFWSPTKGVNQLAKCAESLALRKAFPEELSGLYTTEEMHQAGGVREKDEWEIRWAELQRVAATVDLSTDALKATLKALGASKPSDLADEAIYDAALRAINGEVGDVIEGEVVEEPTEEQKEAAIFGPDTGQGVLEKLKSKPADPDAA